MAFFLIIGFLLIVYGIIQGIKIESALGSGTGAIFAFVLIFLGVFCLIAGGIDFSFIKVLENNLLLVCIAVVILTIVVGSIFNKE